jgi:hypothetical protein
MIGFWIGIGFIIPSIAKDLLSTAVPLSLIPGAIRQVDSEADFISEYMDDSDLTSQIEILSHREQPMDGGPLLILGRLKNTGIKTVNSVHLEVELMNENQEMVYECSDYISQRLKPGAEENFQVKCGCNNIVLPQHDSYTLRVTKANNY